MCQKASLTLWELAVVLAGAALLCNMALDGLPVIVDLLPLPRYTVLLEGLFTGMFELALRFFDISFPNVCKAD